MFKPHRIYIKLRRDHVEVTDLESGQTISQSALEPFSSSRNVVSSFNGAELSIRKVIEQFGLKRLLFFSPSFKVLIQQLEGAEGGLSQIERRALQDLGEQIGGRKIYVLGDDKLLTTQEALDYLDREK